jgi:putative flippase GtrA
MSVPAGVAAVFAGYVATALTFRIWYSTWPFAWLVLDHQHHRRALSAGFWFLLTAHLSILIYGHLRVYALGGSQTLAHLIGVPFTFVLPLFLARWLPLRHAAAV